MAVENRLEQVILNWSAKHGFRLTTEALAEATGIDYKALARIVNDANKSIKLDYLDRLCEVLEVEPGDILVRVPNNVPLTRPLLQPARERHLYFKRGQPMPITR